MEPKRRFTRLELFNIVLNATMLANAGHQLLDPDTTPGQRLLFAVVGLCFGAALIGYWLQRRARTR